jgi:peptide/nickel transport system substrate-binding protein
MSPRKGLRFAALAGLVILVVAVLGASVGQSRPLTAKHATASVLLDGTTDSVTNVDPAGNYDYGSATVDVMIYQHLYELKAGGAVTPGLATGCKSNGALTVWTCKLRQGVKFSNGDSFTSADVKWSFDRVLKIKDPSGIYTLISNVSKVTTSGPYGVTFRLKSPQATWLQILATGAGMIVDRGTHPADKLVANTDVGNLVGTGPYVLSKYTPGQSAVFTPNSNYWGPKPKNGGVIITYYSKSSTMKLALQKGEIDMAFRDFTPTEYGSLAKASGITVHKGAGVNIRYLVLNMTQAPTNNLGVRQAIAYLMPRQTLASRVYHGLVKPLYSMVPAGLPGHIDAFATRYGRSPSVAKAKAALQKAGVSTPVPLTIWWTPSHYGDASADEYSELQRALNASGLFKVTLKSAEWATYSKTLGTQYGAFQLGWFPDYVDAEDYVVPFYAKGNFTSNNYSSPVMTALLKKEAGAKTTSKRLGYIRQAQTLAAKDVPVIPYWQGTMVAVAHNNVHGIDGTLDPSFIMRFWQLSKS